MRSLLFVPGDAERKLDKGLQSGADLLILDLEDSVTFAAKPKAREALGEFLRTHRMAKTRPRLYVRINALQSGLAEADLEAIMPAGPDGILLPKPRSGADVGKLSRMLDEAEKSAGIVVGETRIIPITTEVPASLLVMHTYVDSSPRLAALAWGAEDLSADLGATATRDPSGTLNSPFLLARNLCLMTSAASGVGAVDTVYLDLRDRDGLAREAMEAARDGFTGKLAIHPDQVAVINQAFTPSLAQIARAKEIVKAFKAGGGTGVLSFDGEMLDRPHLRRAERVLERAWLAGLDT